MIHALLPLFLAPLLPVPLLPVPLLRGSAQETPADAEPVPEVRTIDGDEQKRWVLHAPPAGTPAPQEGWRLLVVMPGGDGGVDFRAFVGRIREQALDERWLVAQIVAPVWAEEQAERLVWPTKRNPWPMMRFACEELFHDALAAVEAEHQLDPRYLFTLAWSSSGMLAYTLALDKESRVTGTFVAMSVYKPDLLPSLKYAKNRAFHLLHSPEDFIPIAQAEDARDDLEKKKAVVELATYAGGHGWKGDMYGMLRTGFARLERHAADAKPPKSVRR
jgi:predicted esterase